MTAIDRSIASLRFVGEDLNPDDLLKSLEFSSSDELAKPTIKNRGNVTILSVSYIESDSSELETKILFILSRFTKNITVWKEISEKCKGDIFCGLFLDGWNRGFELSRNLLNELSERNLALGFDIYSPTERF